MRVVETRGAKREVVRDDAEVFGFRAGGDWLLLREPGSPDLVEWSPRTNAQRPSSFAPMMHDVAHVCFAPDDTTLVATLTDGSTVVRSPTSETSLLSRTYEPSAPLDCAFSPDKKTFALSDDERIAAYRLGDPAARRWLTLANAEHLAWTIDGRALELTIRDPADGGGWITFSWTPDNGRLVGSSTGGPAASHPRRREMLIRAGCRWQRLSADGERLPPLTPEPGMCFHVTAHEVVLSPTGSFVAALEGEWGGARLELLPLK